MCFLGLLSTQECPSYCVSVCKGLSFLTAIMSSSDLSCPLHLHHLTFTTTSSIMQHLWYKLILADLASLARLASFHSYVRRRYSYEGSCKNVPHIQVVQNIFSEEPLQNKSTSYFHLLWNCFHC